MPTTLKLAPLGAVQPFQDALFEDPDGQTLREFLARWPAFSVGTPLTDAMLDTTLGRMVIDTVDAAAANRQPLHAPPGLLPKLATAPSPGAAPAPPGAEDAPSPVDGDVADATAPGAGDLPSAPMPAASAHPRRLNEEETIAIAYAAQVKKLATFLRSSLSLLISCEKLVVPHLWRRIVSETWVVGADGREKRLEPKVLELPAEGAEGNPAASGKTRLAQLRAVIHELKPHQVLVIPNLDLLGGGGEKGLSRESRELTEVIFGALDRLILAFADPSLPLPEVIAARFAVRYTVEGLDRDVEGPNGRPIPITQALVTAGEAAMFRGFDAQEFYKNVAGLNPLRLREALAYAVQVARDQGHSPEQPADVALLHREVRAFKAQSAEQFTVPNVTFDQIGGYDEVKTTLLEAIALISGQGRLPDERLRHELIPRGFLFHGPPGTGKTLFAKAIANELNASVRIVSGPEVTDMYVGEGERKVRSIFAEARRNAPAVIVFDEFDSIAGRRSGRDDGGSRAGNALVAQILTEMDGFRPEVPMLVVGTTNQLKLIDDALLRPSRFQAVAIELPNLAARRHIVHIHTKHFGIAVDDELVEILAHGTDGLNGDEIRCLFRDAHVAQFYKQPPQPADARQLGYLLGRIRSRLDAQKTQSTSARGPHDPQQRRRPAGPMMIITPVRTAMPADASVASSAAAPASAPAAAPAAPSPQNG